MITGTMNVPMTLEKANYYNTLEKRDIPMAVERNSYVLEGEEKFFYKCPVCGEYVYKENVFCKMCGQRIDFDNIAL